MQTDYFSEQTLDKISDALQQSAYIVLPQFFNQSLLKDLQQRVQQLTPSQWQAAGVGRQKDYQLNTDIRSDKIAWLSTDNAIESNFLNSMETLRLGINRRLFLGLFDFESHFAVYPQGSFYQKHVDALQGQSNRVVSMVLYLNNDWQPTDAGELLIYQESGEQPIETVSPQLGTLVIFLSEKIPHEVIKAHRQRFSIAGWFRINPSHSQHIDPNH